MPYFNSPCLAGIENLIKISTFADRDSKEIIVSMINGALHTQITLIIEKSINRTMRNSMRSEGS